MNRFITNHFQILLVFLGLILLGLIIFYVLWGMDIIVRNITKAISQPASRSTDFVFNLEAARKLNLPVER